MRVYERKDEIDMTIKEIVGEDKYHVNEVGLMFHVDKNNSDYYLYCPTVYGIDDLYTVIPMLGSRDFIKGLDKIRKENGQLPLFYNDEDPNEIDYDSWYEMRLAVHQNRKVELCFWVDGFTEDSYTDIELTDEEQDLLFKCTDSYCEREYGETLEKIFAEEEKNLKDYYEAKPKGETQNVSI